MQVWHRKEESSRGDQPLCSCPSLSPLLYRGGAQRASREAEKYLGKPLDKAFQVSIPERLGANPGLSSQVGDWSHRPLSQAGGPYVDDSKL